MGGLGGWNPSPNFRKIKFYLKFHHNTTDIVQSAESIE